MADILNIETGYKLLLAILLAAIGTWLFKKVAWRLNILDKPKGTVPQHVKATPYLGGLGIYFGIITSSIVASFIWSDDIQISFLIFCFLFMLLGLIDDLLELRPMKKFLIQVVVAIGAAYYCASFDFTGIHIVDLLISAFWYLVLLNAFNVTDVCDGLLAGLSVVAFLVGAIIFAPNNLVMVISAGATLGYLFFNKPPASIFMGDAGSHLLGFIAGYITMNTPVVLEGTYSFLILGFLCAVPIFEMTFLIVMRTLKGKKWYLSSRDHFALRLQRHGFSKWQTIILAWILAFIATAPIFYIINESQYQFRILFIIAAIVVAVFLIFWWYLIKIEKEDDAKLEAGN
ncbi:MAG: undecaprenyl/decaprenyl-phosphate alpha-N-acetylglucosaminyl 1-phosphate transferase [Saprospiraceae bacterium]|nr:undecaprenyl/decaprenyl-phosphate alpha-N-acetylglucosaminyl 1-phosphate transferase [Saprospiraceae bacterium]